MPAGYLVGPPQDAAEPRIQAGGTSVKMYLRRGTRMLDRQRR